MYLSIAATTQDPAGQDLHQRTIDILQKIHQSCAQSWKKNEVFWGKVVSFYDWISRDSPCMWAGSRSRKALRKPEESVPPSLGSPRTNLQKLLLCTPYILYIGTNTILPM